MKMSLVLHLSSVVLPLVNGVTSCKLFHKKDKWHNWSKLYYSWIKLTLIAIYKSSFLYIKWNKIQLWKLVCFIMQLKWDFILNVFSTIFSFSTYWSNAWTISVLPMVLWRYVHGVMKICVWCYQV
jgi:hypothetical protein